MKRTAALIAALLAVTSLAACGSETKVETNAEVCTYLQENVAPDIVKTEHAYDWETSAKGFKKHQEDFLAVSKTAKNEDVAKSLALIAEATKLLDSLETVDQIKTHTDMLNLFADVLEETCQ